MTPREALKRYFGYDSFRPGQEEIVSALLAGRDALAIMPTGAGKSLCYQVPALLLPGLTLVISPLISLMQDQVKGLNAAGIHAAFINSSLTETQIARALGLAAEGSYKLVYVAPERLESPVFRSFAAGADISMITVDEAHCISQWGQDFRPSYLKILDFIDSLPRRPIVSAFTATATREVKDDIVCTLRLHDPKVLVTGFDRPNLYFQVERTRRKDDFVIQYLRDHPGESGIIYCATRKNVDKLQELLTEYGFAATKYHAGLPAEARRKNQNDFIYDTAPVIVATNAFGMGIDKSNVRFVLHYNMPQSMENYYQEAGRAGRDGLPSQCVLLFSAQDVIINKFLLDKKDFAEMDDEEADLLRQRDLQRLQTMERYCQTTECLRNYILAYFGEHPTAPCGNCGSCNNDFDEVDMTDAAKWMINCVAELRGRYGKAILFGTLQGANRARLRELGAERFKSYGRMKDTPRETLERLLAQLLEDGYLVQSDDQYAVLHIGAVDARDALVGRGVKLLVAAEQTGMAFQARADADQEVDAGTCDHPRDTAVEFVVGKPALRDIRQDERTAAVQRHAVQVIECQRQRIEVEVIGVVDQDRIVDALLHLEAHGQRRRRSERRRGIVHRGAERLDDLGIAARRGVADDRFGHLGECRGIEGFAVGETRRDHAPQRFIIAVVDDFRSIAGQHHLLVALLLEIEEILLVRVADRGKNNHVGTDDALQPLHLSGLRNARLEDG